MGGGGIELLCRAGWNAASRKRGHGSWLESFKLVNKSQEEGGAFHVKMAEMLGLLTRDDIDVSLALRLRRASRIQAAACCDRGWDYCLGVGGVPTSRSRFLRV